MQTDQPDEIVIVSERRSDAKTEVALVRFAELP